MKVGNKIPFIKQWVIVLLILFSSLVKADAIENKIETTCYILKMSTRNCAVNIYLNDLEIVSIDSASAGVGVGEYLKPKIIF